MAFLTTFGFFFSSLLGRGQMEMLKRLIFLRVSTLLLLPAVLPLFSLSIVVCVCVCAEAIYK